MSDKLNEVLKLVKEGVPQVEIAKIFNISQPAISLMMSRAGYCSHCGRWNKKEQK